MSQDTDPELKPDATLENTYWKLVELEGEPTIVLPNLREAHFVLTVEERKVRGSGGCNRLMGSYETSGNRLSFGPLATTRKMCFGIMEQEQAFFEALGSTTHYQIRGDTMQLFAEERLLARFEAVYLF